MRAAEIFPCFAKACQQTHPDGIDEAANVKAGWLRALARDNTNSLLVGPIEFANLLATVICSFSEPRLPCLPGDLWQSRDY
jgi:aconitase B